VNATGKYKRQRQGMASLKNFWIPPAQGYTQLSRGLTLAQLAAIEARNGFPLPAAYKTLMQLQNGESLRYTQCGELLVEHFWPLSDTAQELVTFEDYMRLSCSDEEILEGKKSLGYCNLQRLIIFACESHEIGCFDYGWRSKAVLADPQVVFFCDYGMDILHFGVVQTVANFDTFLAQLELTDHLANRTYLGIESHHSFDTLCALLASALQVELALQDNNRSGWFNFEKWFHINVPLHLDDFTLRSYAQDNGTTFDEVLDWVGSEGRSRQIASLLYPNQHRSGTYMYPDNPEVVAVLEIPKPWFPVARAVAQLVGQLELLDGVKAIARLNVQRTVPQVL
jgi:SMI1 / KNR4 family (SUKH-1)